MGWTTSSYIGSHVDKQALYEVSDVLELGGRQLLRFIFDGLSQVLAIA